MVGLFIAGLVLSTLVAGVSLFGPVAAGCRGGSTLRLWLLHLGGFGFAGLGLSLAGVSAPLALILAALLGSMMARLAHPLLDETSDDVGLGWLSGASGRVVLPIGRQRGKVAIHTGRGRLELPARSDDGGRIERGTEVFVAWVENGEACVVDLHGSRGGQSARPRPDRRS